MTRRGLTWARRVAGPLVAAWALAGCAPGPRPSGLAAGGAPDCEAAASGLAGPEALGCATERNLKAMLADPRDLARPRDAGPPVGDAAVGAVRRHAAGAAGPLPPTAGPASRAASSGSRPE